MTLRWPFLGAAGLAVVVFAVGGYLRGSSNASTRNDAQHARQVAYRGALLGAKTAANQHAQTKGLKAGRQSGQRQGRAVGLKRGETAGSRDAESRSANSSTQQEQSQVDPGAPLTSYCDAHPEVVAQFGFCPSLNE